jgi:hypothetical protein
MEEKEVKRGEESEAGRCVCEWSMKRGGGQAQVGR